MVLTIRNFAAAALSLVIHTASASAQGQVLSFPPTARPLLYGFALECVDCQPGEGARGRSGGGQPAVFKYNSFPRVAAVAPGSAAEQAGIHAGDILLSIDGLSMLTESGAQRFARAVNGEEARLGFERDGKPIAIALTLGSSAGRGRGSGPVRMLGGYLALNGRVNGDIHMEIWSDEPMFATDSTDTWVLRIGTGTIIKLQRKKDSSDTTGANGRGRSSGKPESDRQP